MRSVVGDSVLGGGRVVSFSGGYSPAQFRPSEPLSQPTPPTKQQHDLKQWLLPIRLAPLKQRPHIRVLCALASRSAS